MSTPTSPVGQELINFFTSVVENEAAWLQARNDFDALVRSSSLSPEAEALALSRDVDELVKVMGIGHGTSLEVAVVVIAAIHPHTGGGSYG